MILTPPPTGGQQILRHALARRWVSIVAGTLAGLVVGVGAALVVPVSHSATVSMTVTTPALTPAPTVRASLSNTTDMVTERGIATSAAVLDVAAARLGNGVSAADLRANVEVSGDTNGTIVNIEYVADTRDQAVDAADAIANAYLTERTALVEQRADEIAASINEQISVLEAELASLAPVVDEAGNAKDNPRAAEIRTELTKLAKDAEQLTPYHATAGRVITPAAASDDEVSPSKLRLVLIMTVVGIFAGLVMVLVRETRSRSLASPTQLADLTALPVWSAEEGAPEPWLAPTRMLAMAIDRDHWVDLIVDASDPQARDLHRVLSASLAETRVPAPRLIDIKQPLASLLNEVRPSRHVLVAVRKGHDLKALHALLDELAIINREVNGMIYLGDQVAPVAPSASTPAPAAEVIVPAHYNGTTHEVAVGVPTKETENTANTTGAKNADTAGTSFVKKGEK